MKCGPFFRLLLGILALCGAAGCGDKSNNPPPPGETRWASFPIDLRNDGFASAPDSVAASADFDAAVQFWNGQFALHQPGTVVFASSGPFLNPFATASITDSSILSETGVATTATWPLAASVAGTTVRSIVNGRIGNAVVAMNAANFNFCHGICGAPTDVSYRRVLAHELGHLIGITEHSDDPANVMYDGNYHDGDLNNAVADPGRMRALTP